MLELCGVHSRLLGLLVVARFKMSESSEHAENEALARDTNAYTDSSGSGASTEGQKVWSPSGSAWRDFLYFCGPGWFVSSK